jgi:glycosyltransferase involved in cell wall biosynthesis
MTVERNIQAFFYGNPDQYPPIINSARLLAHAGFELDIFCRWDPQDWAVSYPSSVRIHRIKTSNGSSWFEYTAFVLKSLRLARRSGVFIGHDMHGLLPARILGARHRRPVIYHCHDFSESARQLAFGSRMVRTVERSLARTTQIVLVPDKDRAFHVASELRLLRPPVITANAPLTRPNPHFNGLQSKLRERARHFEAIVFRQGRIGEGHAIETTLRSIPLWENKRWGFVIMGIAENTYLEKLTRQAETLGVGNQFVSLPPVGYDDVAPFTSGADLGHALYEPIHINNAHIATASNKIMEYMEAGLPLLVSDTPALRNLVDRYGCGLAADEKSPESIAAAVNTLLGDSDKARIMGSAARRAFEHEFCYERQFAPVIDAITELSNQ